MASPYRLPASSAYALRSQAGRNGHPDLQPRNYVAPVISASAADPITGDDVLTCSTGTWKGYDLSYGFQWLKDNVVVADAIYQTYSRPASESGSVFHCLVTALNPYRQASVLSRPSSYVIPRVLVTWEGAARLAGSGRVEVQALPLGVQLLASKFNGAGALSASTVQKMLEGARLAGAGAASARAIEWMSAGARPSGAGQLSVRVNELETAGGRFAGAGQLSAQATVSSGASTVGQPIGLLLILTRAT